MHKFSCYYDQIFKKEEKGKDHTPEQARNKTYIYK